MGARFDKGDQSARRRAFENAVRREHVEAAAFLYAIVETADRLRAARDFRGELALWLDRRAQLLAAIAQMGGCPTFSDLGRALGVTRQSAREIALAAERAGLVELFTDPYDRRALQVGLTPRGRGELERRRLPASDWLMTLLAGLEDGPRRTTVRVLGVIRDRLRAYEQDLRRAQLGVLGARPPGAR
jgi:DNA-binding MarR family transcriptional regulator